MHQSLERRSVASEPARRGLRYPCCIWLVLAVAFVGAFSGFSYGQTSTDTLGSPLGPVENPSSRLPARGYQSRPCGFDLNDNGIVGEPADCRVCDATPVNGRISVNTTDPDGDGVEEDLIYVDCNGGKNHMNCGRHGATPCRSIEYAWANIADGPSDGAEDIVCFRGTCSPDHYSFRQEFNGVPGHWTKPKSGNEVRDWQYPTNPAMLIGWDSDNDGRFPPFDTDDEAILDGTGSTRALLLNQYDPNSYYEMAHFSALNYGEHTAIASSGGFITMFKVARESTHGNIHDLVLNNINGSAAIESGTIAFGWFNSAQASHITINNIRSSREGGYTFRGSAGYDGTVTAGPWRFQNLTIKARGCDISQCPESGSAKDILKLWGWVDGIEVIDNIFDTNLSDWTPKKVNAMIINALSQDWDVINNEFIDWGTAVNIVGVLPESYPNTPRYTDDIVISRNLVTNFLREGAVFFNIYGFGGNQQAVRNVWILNNKVTSAVPPKAFVHIKQANTEGPCATNVRIVNNTFYGDTKYGIWVPDTSHENGLERLSLKNNVFAGLSQGHENLRLKTPIEYLNSDFNVFDEDADYSLAGDSATSLPDWRVISGGDIHSLTCTPAFVDPPFSVALDSGDVCAKDRGTDLSYLTTTDADGDSRPYGVKWDRGADEWSPGIFWDFFETSLLDGWSNVVQ